MSVTTGTTQPTVSDPTPSRLCIFWMSTVGKKILMALSGAILFLYVVAHLLGNMQLYLGEEVINRYAHFLHSNEGFLWFARIVLLAAVAVHGIAGIQLWLQRHAARPVPYRVKETIQASTASRTMIWSGFVITAFVVYHVLDLTVGVPGVHHGAYVHLDAYHNLVQGFSHPVPVVLYMAAMVGLGFHLWHGVYSMFGTLGLSHPRYTELVKRGAALVATLIALANVSVPLSILTGLVK